MAAGSGAPVVGPIARLVTTLRSVDADVPPVEVALRSAHAIYVDAMNVIGSRPNGWWRDRDGAVRRLAADLQPFAAGLGAEVVLVVDGRPIEGLPEGRHDAVLVQYARRMGSDAADDRLIELLDAAAPTDAVARSGGSEGHVVVVTADRALRERAAARGAGWAGPRTFLRAVDAASSAAR